jgi:tRNA-specific 2-thiouridylase
MRESAADSSRRGKVLLAMSGGVDSSVAAVLLQERGFEVVGCFMRLGGAEEPQGLVADDHDGDAEGAACRPRPHKQGCCSVNDAADARLVAARLGMPLYVCNFRREFGRVMEYFAAEYHAGRTPNPCVRCNDWLKFGRLHEYAAELGCGWVASGHYARIAFDGEGRAVLQRGLDRAKDQSYVLFGIRPDRLERTLLPIGELAKAEVRAIARERCLPVFDKPDSQEICFVPDRDYAGFLARRSPESLQPGRLLDPEGRELGTHGGHQHFTIGQRRGLGVASSVPLFVLSKDPRRNEVVVGPREAFRAAGAEASQVNWLGPRPVGAFTCAVQWRAHGDAVSAEATLLEDASGDRLLVRFETPQEILAPGQALVCYRGDEVLGGAWIDRSVPLADASGASRSA